jgi:predicted nucleic acid-binding protein
VSVVVDSSVLVAALVDPFAERIWELRHAITSYDAWYVAIAEALRLPLATLDKRLARARGPKCEFLTVT